MDSRLAESWINRDDHVVLGRKLHDYCLYHALFLSLAGNRIYFNKPASLDDLREAVLICSLPPDTFLRARKIMSPRARMFWLWRTRKAAPVLEFKRFELYLQDFDARPHFWSDETSEGGLRAPWLLSMSVFIESHSNMTEHEIMSAPLGKMFWKSAGLAEVFGMSRAEIVTEEEEEAMKEMGIDL